jgi:hypothetical protein
MSFGPSTATGHQLAPKMNWIERASKNLIGDPRGIAVSTAQGARKMMPSKRRMLRSEICQ